MTRKFIHEKTKKRLKETEEERAIARRIVKTRLEKMNESTKKLKKLKKQGLAKPKLIIYPSQERALPHGR